MAVVNYRIHDRGALSRGRHVAERIDADRFRSAGGREMIRVALTLAFALPLGAQSPQELAKEGEQIFNKTCATGYCHALKGGSGGGAPRLAARGFDEQYINAITT